MEVEKVDQMKKKKLHEYHDYFLFFLLIKKVRKCGSTSKKILEETGAVNVNKEKRCKIKYYFVSPKQYF